MSETLVPRKDAPPYVPITMQDVWGEVKERWADMYSPEASCPVSEYGPVGSPSQTVCRKTYEETWNKIKDELPDYPSGGPYNPPVDLVSVEDICYVGSHPEDESFPNLFDDLGALAKRLQESWKRRNAARYCEAAPPEFPPTAGGCICMPYFVTVSYETRSTPGVGEWIPAEPSTSPVWGPISGVSVINQDISPEAPLGGYRVVVNAQGGVLNFRNGWNCRPERIEAVTAASSGGEARIAGGGSVFPFSVADCEFYFGQVPEGYPNLTGECPVPFPPQPSDPLPNTTPYLVPNSPPVFAFPVNGPACPEETDVLEIKIVYEGGAGPAGPPGADGEKGRAGETTMRRAVKLFSEVTLGESEAKPGNDIDTSLPEGCAFVRVDWLGVLGFPKAEYPRQFHSSPNKGTLDEFLLGRIFVGIEGEEGWSVPFCQASKAQSLVSIPDIPGKQLRISVTDVVGVGVRVVDIGYRFRDFRWTNPESIPGVEYTSP